MGDLAGGKPTVWEMVNQAIEALGGSTTNAAVRRWIWERWPGTNRSTIDCQMIAGCVNHPSRVHHRAIDARPRAANNPVVDRFFRPEKGRIEFYDPTKRGKWGIYETAEGKLSVREGNEWGKGVDPGPSEVELAEEVKGKPCSKPDGEDAWAARLQPQLEAALQSLSHGGKKLRVDAKCRLPYAYEVMGYREQTPEKPRLARYETDLLIFDETDDESDDGKLWIPRVVIECKIRGVTTHDALTYSSKSATHKQVHPYLRYGMLVGSYGSVLPARLVRHGAYFDFMAVWEEAEPSATEWEELVDVLRLEVRASRLLQELLSGAGKGKRTFRMLHRRLELTG